MGSGSTKAMVARVDTCKETILEVIDPGPNETFHAKLLFKEGLVSGSVGPALSAEVRTSGLAAIQQLVERAKRSGASTLVGVATAVFREAINGKEFIQEVNARTGARIRVISQQEEAELGVRSAVAVVAVDLSQVVVWDIGGASMQISAWNPTRGKFMTSLNRFASGPMRAAVIRQVQGKKSAEAGTSPNPMGRKDAAKAIELAGIQARRLVADAFINGVRGREWLGIGGVHALSICELLQGQSAADCSYTLEELEARLLELSELTDRQLIEGGHVGAIEYARGAVTNAALVCGFMKALGIKQVRTLDVSLVQGVLVHERIAGS